MYKSYEPVILLLKVDRELSFSSLRSLPTRPRRKYTLDKRVGSLKTHRSLTLQTTELLTVFENVLAFLSLMASKNSFSNSRYYSNSYNESPRRSVVNLICAPHNSRKCLLGCRPLRAQ